MNIPEQICEDVFNDTLQCYFRGCRIFSDTKIALYLGDESACDMSGAIKMAEMLLPNVRRIVAFSGEVPNVVYELRNGVWVCLVLKKSR